MQRCHARVDTDSVSPRRKGGLTGLIVDETIGWSGRLDAVGGVCSARISSDRLVVALDLWDPNGIALGGGNGSVRGVTVTRDSIGVEIESSDNSVRGNIDTSNGFGVFGIDVDTGTGNTIIGNSAHGNSGFDLVDNNA